ncbi:molybdotransferase-like divisome protein Glp [Aquipuribacter sp. MA13-6]|uniref:molybdotransferase-like divisome protein Glp n=1 Tax=unclassified Aquipuribacter TaxID=2635084 RepID=UPI003EEEC2FF
MSRGAGGPVPVEQHLADCLALLRPLPPVVLPVTEVLDRVLDEDVVARAPLPGDDNSGMDGYAVRCADVAGASPEHPVVLPVLGDVAAGGHVPAPLAPGTSVRIMTGGLVPPGADGVVPVEDTDGGTAQVQVRAPATPGRFVRRAGDDVQAGETVLRAGTRLSPRTMSLLVAVGREHVRVRGVPRVVVMSTGDEVVQPGATLRPGQVYDSNGIGLAAYAAELGCEVTRVPAVDDDADGLRAALADAVDRADLLITSGGVSMGAFDVVKSLLRETGTVTFRKVAMQPGGPQGVGVLGEGRVPVLCLPGNPVSSMVSFEVFARPVLRTLLGEAQVGRPRVRATVREGWRSPAGKRQYARVALSHDGAEVVCTPVGGQGSHLVADLAAADALAEVPEATTGVEVGSVLDCLVLGRGRA